MKIGHVCYDNNFNIMVFTAFKQMLCDMLDKYDKIILWGCDNFGLFILNVAYEFKHLLYQYKDRISIMHLMPDDDYCNEIDKTHCAREAANNVISAKYGGDIIDLTPYEKQSWEIFYNYPIDITRKFVDDIDNKLHTNIKYIVFNFPDESGNDKALLNFVNTNINAYNIECGHFIVPYPIDDNHHFAILYHYKTLLYMVFDILGLSGVYNHNDFDEIPKFCINGTYCPSFKPKQDMQFLVEPTFTPDNNKVICGGHEILRGNENTTYKADYHSTFAFNLQNVKITNLTIDTDRILLLNTDSQMLPEIPLLACYFKKIIVLDNREGILAYNLFKDEHITHHLVTMCPCHDLYKYLYRNII